MDNQYVISINISGSKYWDTHHPQLPSGGMQFFHSDLYDKKLYATDVSIKDFFLEYQLINDMFIYIVNLVLDFLVFFLPA